MGAGFLDTVKEQAQEIPGVTQVEIKGGISWLLIHEKFILTTFVLLLILFLGYKFIDGHYNSVKAEESLTAQTLANQQESNKALQTSYAALQIQTVQANAQLQAQNATLAQQAANAYKAAAAQAASDQRLNNDQLAARLDALTNQQGIQSNPNGVTLTHDQSVGVTTTLDTIPALKEQVASDILIKSNDDKQILGLTSQGLVCDNLNKGLNTQIVDQQKECTAQIKVLKAHNLKSTLKSFGLGFIAGFLTGVFK
jgi:hypothetical protein